MDPNNNNPNQTPLGSKPWSPQDQSVAPVSSTPPEPSPPFLSQPTSPASTPQQPAIPTFQPPLSQSAPVPSGTGQAPAEPPPAEPAPEPPPAAWANPNPISPQEPLQMPSEQPQPQPTFTPSQPPPQVPDLGNPLGSLPWAPPSVGQQPESLPPESPGGAASALGTISSVDTAPTDLSQLAASPPALPTDQSLTLPSVDSVAIPTSTNENNNSTPQVVTADGKRHISKWIFIIGGLILLLAIGGSAYFLLFANNTQPISEVEQSLPNPTIQPTPPPAIIEQEPVTSPSAQSSPSAKSAIELLRERQNQQR